MKRHGTGDSAAEPLVDPSQDYELTLGYENATHTVLRFKRKLDTCDTSHDISITVSSTCTMHSIYTYIRSICIWDYNIQQQREAMYCAWRILH